MNTREALNAELDTAPEAIVKQAYDFVRFLKSTAPLEIEPTGNPQKVDFEALRKSIFGDRIIADSQPILDEMRADRF